MRSVRDLLRKIRSGSKPISEYQWLFLARLLQRNYSLKDALEYMCHMENADSLRKLKDDLLSGKTLSQCLGNSRFERELSFYLKYIPLDKSILLTSELHRKKDDLKKKAASKLSYCGLLLLASCGLIFLFSGYVVPSMLDNLEMDEATSQLKLTFELLSKTVIIMPIITTLLFVSFTVMHYRRREIYLWNHVHRLHLDGLIRLFVTYEFASRLKSMLNNGISIRDGVEVIRYDHNNPLTALLAHHFDEMLLTGQSFESSLRNEFLDDDFYSLCLLGIKSDELVQGIADYLDITRIKVEHWLNRFSSILQAACYLIVTVVIVLGYQVLLMPLDSLRLY